jgi:hypothetical protein
VKPLVRNKRFSTGVARAKAEGITLGRRPIEESDAGKYEANKAALAAKQGVRRMRASCRPVSVQCCGSRQNSQLKFLQNLNTGTLRTSLILPA